MQRIDGSTNPSLISHHSRTSLRSKDVSITSYGFTREEMTHQTEIALTSNLLGSELLFQLFLASIKSYRRSMISEPFPNAFMKEDGEKDYDYLKLLCEAIPALHTLSKDPQPLKNLPKRVLELLHWVVAFPHSCIQLNAIPLESVDFIPTDRKDLIPNYVFEVQYENSKLEQFEALKASHGSLLGFHGSPFENFHSILRNGFDASFSRPNALFGQGIYFAENLDVASSFRTPKSLWESSIGPQASMIAVCEVVKHPTFMKEGYDISQVGLWDESKIPKGYIVATSQSILKIRYVLVYTHAQSSISSKSNRKWTFWILVIVIYIVFLLCLYISKSTRLRRRNEEEE